MQECNKNTLVKWIIFALLAYMMARLTGVLISFSLVLGHTMANDFRKKGIEFAKLAIEAENGNNKVEALRCYTLCLEYLTTDMKYEKSPKIKATLQAKARGYLEHAEKLKEELNPVTAPQSSGMAARQRPQSPQNNSAKDDESNESQQRRDMLKAGTLLQPGNAHHVRWNDIAGLKTAKQFLQESIVLPMRLPHLFGHDSPAKRKPWTAVLLYGPPGTGKTQLARAVATESNCTFFSVSASSLVSKWVGESEKAVRDLFQLARESKPSILFIDEIESLCGHRGDSNESESAKRIKSEFLSQTNDMADILLLAATNLPWAIDPAFRRRFVKRIYIPLPDFEARQQLFMIHLNGKDHKLELDDVNEFAKETEGYSGADIATLIDEAYMLPVRLLSTATYFVQRQDKWYPCESNEPGAALMTWNEVADYASLRVEPITRNHLLKARQDTPPTVSQDDIGRYDSWTLEFGKRD